MKILLIGDVHGLTNSYFNVLKTNAPEMSIQLGDFGFRDHHQWHRSRINGSKQKVLFGNHDNTACLPMLHSLGDYGFDRPKGLFWVRGANSIDKHLRTQGVDWWADEELSIVRFNDVLDSYERQKPRIVLSHDCPQSIRKSLFGIHDSSRTSQGLQAMLEIHRPEMWFFGHHHKSATEIVSGTRFQCLNEMEAIWIES